MGSSGIGKKGEGGGYENRYSSTWQNLKKMEGGRPRSENKDYGNAKQGGRRKEG